MTRTAPCKHAALVNAARTPAFNGSLARPGSQNGAKAPTAGIVKRRQVRCTHLRLRQLVVVVREAQVNAAGMDVHVGAQDVAGHHGALNVPTGPSLRNQRCDRAHNRGGDGVITLSCRREKIYKKTRRECIASSLSRPSPPVPRASPRQALRAWMPSIAQSQSWIAYPPWPPRHLIGG